MNNQARYQNNQNLLFSFSLRISLILFIGICALFMFACAGADQPESQIPGVITFQLTGSGDDTILWVSLMKEGDSSKNGMVRQDQNIEFNRESSEIQWNPCNDNSCMIFSSPTAGGTTGRDQLILEITLANPAVDVSSCSGDPTCERLKGRTFTKSGMLDGIFYTGKTYTVALDSLQAGFGEAFKVTEVQ
jgi:hypothetical protein